MKYTTINIQGNLLSEEILQKVETAEASGQQATDFGFEPGTNIRSEIEYAWSRIKLDWKHFSDKSTNLPASDPYGTTLSRRWMEQFLSSLGFNHTRQKSSLLGENNQAYTISHTADNLDDLPIHIMGFYEPDKPDKNTLDIKTSGGTSRLSPHATVQEYLNVTEHLFGIAANGLHLRLIRDSGRLIKLTYVEFDLKRMLDEDKYSEFALLYRLLHASRFPKNKAEADQCLLEKYYQESIETGNRIRDGLSQAVKESLVALGNGLLNQPENQHLREAYENGQLTAYELNHQLLRLIYRLLFLIVTEERDLVYDNTNNSEEQKRNRDTYYRFYSLARLRKLSATRYLFEPQYTDLWQGLMQTFSFFEPGNKGVKLGIQPLGGELFQPSAIQHIRESLINNRVLLECIRSLNEFEDAKKNRVLINFRSLDVEELGSIYEGLLELSPVIHSDGRQYEFTYEKGSERSSSGSHYTPEDLVKPLIQHSLEYLIDDRVQSYYKGKITGDAAIQSLLNLKVADVACGSGHILLSAARRIAHEVARIESGEQQPNPQSFRKALKQVIRHCIYGVDKNPLAVELCKVALWLESHNPGEPLNFLDHHIKCGDAIVGLAHRRELENGIADEAFKTLSGDDKDIASAFRNKNKQERKMKTQTTLQFDAAVAEEVNAVIEKFNLFKNLPETTPEEVAKKEREYRNFEQSVERLRLKQLADAQVAQFFIPKTEATKAYLMTDAEYRNFLRNVNKGMGPLQSQKLAYVETLLPQYRFFHWFIEFPEVFQNGGFDCVLGNPPFLGDRRLKEAFGEEFLEWIRYYFTEGATVDLVVYFFLRINSVLRENGFQSLISTNTVAQGKAREFGLEKIIANGSVLNHAVKGMKWPGLAAVEVSLITLYKGNWKGKFFLNGKQTDQISPFLDEADNTGTPFPLFANDGKSFQGSIILGMGFVLDPNEAESLISIDPKNKDVILPYLNGDDLNNNPDQSPSRFVINFQDWDEEVASKYPSSYSVILEKVKPERQRWKEDKEGNPIEGQYALRHPLPEKWWQHCEKRPALYKAASKKNRVLVSCRVSKYVNQSFVEVRAIYDVATSVVIRSGYWEYAFLQSSIHDQWAWKYASTLESRIRYVNVDCIDTFPILDNLSNEIQQKLESIGETYHKHRKQLMLGMQLGLTKTYNLFHSNAITAQGIHEDDKQVAALQKHLVKTDGTISLNEAIQGILKLRELHVQMDEVVLEAYGWTDIALRHDFYDVDYLPENDRIRFTIHPDTRKEVLKRLLELNHKIHDEEVKAGLWDKKKTPAKKKKSGEASNVVNEPHAGYGGLFKEEEES
jgi:hypothetical protein